MNLRPNTGFLRNPPASACCGLALGRRFGHNNTNEGLDQDDWPLGFLGAGRPWMAWQDAADGAPLRFAKWLMLPLGARRTSLSIATDNLTLPTVRTRRHGSSICRLRTDDWSQYANDI